jgi:NAD(P)-dependent dehydrogenase (short-subunit alcohol dehydrogenase family)
MAKVLITGTSKGIGYHATLLLARAGHEVVATMRNPGACDLEKVAAEAKLPVTVLPLDVDDDASVVEVFGKMGDSIDVLVNNAGIYSINAVEDESLDQFRRVVDRPTREDGDAAREAKVSAPNPQNGTESV